MTYTCAPAFWCISAISARSYLRHYTHRDASTLRTDFIRRWMAVALLPPYPTCHGQKRWQAPKRLSNAARSWQDVWMMLISCETQTAWWHVARTLSVRFSPGHLVDLQWFATLLRMLQMPAHWTYSIISIIFSTSSLSAGCSSESLHCPASFGYWDGSRESGKGLSCLNDEDGHQAKPNSPIHNERGERWGRKRWRKHSFIVLWQKSLLNLHHMTSYDIMWQFISIQNKAEHDLNLTSFVILLL